MKLQEASKKEIKRIAVGIVLCDLIMIAALFLLSQFGIGSFDVLRILLGAFGGSCVAILNFTIMCLTIQNAVATEDKKQMKAKIQASYNARLLLQAAWVIVALVVPVFHVLASAAPLLFPTVIIYYLQLKGTLVSPSDRENPPAEEAEEPEDHLGSFEI